MDLDRGSMECQGATDPEAQSVLGVREDNGEHYNYICDLEENMLELVYHILGLEDLPAPGRYASVRAEGVEGVLDRVSGSDQDPGPDY